MYAAPAVLVVYNCDVFKGVLCVLCAILFLVVAVVFESAKTSSHLELDGRKGGKGGNER